MWLKREGIEQELADAAREALARGWDPGAVRARRLDGSGLSDGWTVVRDMAWLDLLVPEDRGGLGLGPIEAGCVFEEAGRALVPGPLFGTMVVGSMCRSMGLWDDDRTIALAHAEAGSRGMPATSTQDQGNALHGTKTSVEDALSVDTLVVLASTSSADPILAAVDPKADGLEMDPLESVDLIADLADIRLDQVPISAVIATGDKAREMVAEISAMACCLYASRLLGVADRMVELAVDYAKTREQFGQPIGRFQALQHMLADMKVATATARNMCYVSQASLAGGHADALRWSQTAKAYLSLVARSVAENALQVHGGIGFTEEHDLHLYYKHALTLQGAWGDQRVHQDALATQALERRRSASAHEKRMSDPREPVRR